VEFFGTAVHTLSRDGTWDVTATLTNPNGSSKIVHVEVGDTHVSPTSGWTKTKAADNTSYTFVRSGVPSPRPTFSASRPSAATGNIQSDEAGNYYWSVPSGVTLGSGGSKSWTWSNRIWPGE
jgi:hypothetical protein